MAEIYTSMLKKSTIHEMTTGWRTEKTYITQGAYMYCSMGTHAEVLNKIKANGVYINENPIMTVKDCKESSSTLETGLVTYRKLGDKIDGNFYSFGYCRSQFHPVYAFAKNGGLFTDCIDDYDNDAKAFTGGFKVFPCTPKICPTMVNTPAGILPGGIEWSNGSDEVLVNGERAITNYSCLNCAYNGQIKFLSNGMDPVPYELLERGSK